jgi:hypothetical protein
MLKMVIAMEKIIVGLVAAVVCIVIPFTLWAGAIEPGVHYTGKTRLESAEHGVSFTLPHTWTGVFPKGGQFFVMQQPGIEAYIFAGVEKATLSEARLAMGHPLDLGDGVVLHPKGSVHVEGSVLKRQYAVAGTRKPLEGRMTTVVGSHGWSVFFIAVADIPNMTVAASGIDQLYQSLSLGSPAVAAPPPVNMGGSPWLEHLTGRKLTRFYTASGYTEETYIWLCPGGRFYRSFNSGGFGGGASGAFASKNGGRWQVSGGLEAGALTLVYNDGSRAAYTLTHEGTKLFLDGKRYFRESTDCR